MWASQFGHLGVVRVLVENEANVNDKDKDGKLVYKEGILRLDLKT